MMFSKITKYLPTILISFLFSSLAYATVAQNPLFLSISVDPNILFNMSIETPMAGAAYNDEPNTEEGCSGRVNQGGDVGMCYFKEKTYLGYFDPLKCYTYGSDRFNPVAATNSNHECSGQFSGNFLNWSTMTAMDMFIWTMTGGNRVVDGADSITVVRRAQKLNNDNLFPHKLVRMGTGGKNNVAPSTVTPWTNNNIYVSNTAYGVKFGTSRGGDYKGGGGANNIYNVAVRVCDKDQGLEENCVPYDDGSYYKPEGLVQKNADHMRFAVTSYTNTAGNDINGGVLRSNMKYVGSTMPDGSGGTIVNPEAEIRADGTINTNPNTGDASASGVSQSGVIPYLNLFSNAGYKSNDPASELYYESLRYYKNLGPTAEYLTGAKGGFPILGKSRWKDPIQHWCQSNFIIGINDANPWADKRLPGTHFTNKKFNGYNIQYGDYGEPSTPDTDINVTTLTNTVGALEGLNGTSQCIGCTANNCNMSATNKVIPALGEVFGTCPGIQKENSYYIAGLAYYANTQDIRTGSQGTKDFPGKQTVSTFMIDTQEYQSNPLTGRMNMLWLAGKYGGFIDSNDNGKPDLQSEWDADGDGEPDNYVLATEPANLIKSLNSAFDDIVSRVSSASSVATNTTRLDTNTKIYQARFDSGNWSGQLLAYNINDTDGTIGAEAWDAATTSKIIPTGENGRLIYTIDPETNIGIVFEHTNLNDAQKILLNTNHSGVEQTDTEGKLRVDYLRGDQSKEVKNGGVFRNRTTLMGDIINSDPWFAGKEDDLGYTNLSGVEGTSYITFRNSKLTRTPSLFFGANDGLFHAINAETGVELFSYVPATTIPLLSKLTTPFYGCDGAGCISHAYFVDGAPKSGDAYISTGGGDRWHSVLLGTLGAGGKGIFALDVTDPSSFNENNVMWELSTSQAQTASDLVELQNNLGYTLPQASLVRVHDSIAGGSKWAAIVANGYESANHKAMLFIIDAESGKIIRTIDTESGSASAPNGLSTPIAIDENGDKIVDSIYAGDLQGNLWKFDVSSSSHSDWKVAFKTGTTLEPLYIAKDANGVTQPITAKPQVGKHPDGGLMIYFGTGKYYAENDQIISNTSQVQAFYAIRDQGVKVGSRTDLQKQSILYEAAFASLSIEVRVTSDTVVNYSSKKGWYMDLQSPNSLLPEGERVVSAPLLRSGRVIFTTLIPESDPCGWGGTSWLMELDAVNGRRLTTSPFDINEDGNFDIDDLVASYDTNLDGTIDANDHVEVSGMRKQGIGIIKTPGVVTTGDGKEMKYVSGSSGSLDNISESTGDPVGRQSWHQLR